MSAPSLEQLLLLVNCGEKRRLSGSEARVLRDGIRGLDNGRRDHAATIGGLQARIRELKNKLQGAERELAATEPHRVTCPRCGAEPGQRCRAINGTLPPRTPHTARLTASRNDRTREEVTT